MEHRCRKKKTKREEFLEIMDENIPWDEWVSLIVPHYPAGKRGRPPIEIEAMLWMYLLQCWFNLSDEGVEDAIYDSYAMRKFMGLNFFEQDVPDATTRLHFRHLLEDAGRYHCGRHADERGWLAPASIGALRPLHSLVCKKPGYSPLICLFTWLLPVLISISLKL